MSIFSQHSHTLAGFNVKTFPQQKAMAALRSSSTNHPQTLVLIHYRCLSSLAMSRRREVWPSSPLQPSNWRCKLAHLPNFARDIKLHGRKEGCWSCRRLSLSWTGEGGGSETTMKEWPRLPSLHCKIYFTVFVDQVRAAITNSTLNNQPLNHQRYYWTVCCCGLGHWVAAKTQQSIKREWDLHIIILFVLIVPLCCNSCN